MVITVPNLEVPSAVVIFNFTVKLASTKETTNMPKQFLIVGSILALLFAGNLSAQAKRFEPKLLSQVQEEPSSTPAPGGSTTTPVSDGSTSTPVPDSSTTPVPDDSTISPGADDSTTSPNSDGSTTGACESISQARPTGGASREKLQDTQLCNKGV